MHSRANTVASTIRMDLQQGIGMRVSEKLQFLLKLLQEGNNIKDVGKLKNIGYRIIRYI